MNDEHPQPGEGYWYMAGPYSDDILNRYDQHLKAAMILTRTNLTVYSPIIHFHTMAQQYKMPTDADFWENHNYNMLLRSNGLILLCLPNWASSKGVRKELTFSKLKSIPVWALDPPLTPEFVWTRMI